VSIRWETVCCSDLELTIEIVDVIDSFRSPYAGDQHITKPQLTQDKRLTRTKNRRN
jgi:hypothetical protein